MPFEPARLSYDDLHDEAERFLAKYHPDRRLPVPIEEIAEFDFELEIVLIEGILDDLDVDAFLSWTRHQIFMDEFIYKHRRQRARFSLAHELAHYVLHDELYSSVRIESVLDFMSVQESIDHEEYRWLEFQANAMAGFVLVPRVELTQEFRAALSQGLANGLSEDLLLGDVGFPYIEETLIEQFDVSGKVVTRRLEVDGLRRLPPGSTGMN